MYRLIFIIAFFAFFSTGIHAQDTTSFTYYDKETYAAYLRGDWNRVISVGKKALHKKIDYYYLRMRLGIAWFSKHNYHKAIPQFRKALTFNKKDPIAMEYLYSCFLYSGRKADRQALLYKMSPALKEKLNIKKINGISAFELSSDWFYNTDYSSLNGYNPYLSEGTDGEQTLTYRGADIAARLSQNAGKIVSLDYGYRFLSKSRYYFYRDNGVNYEMRDDNYIQHQLYGSIKLHPANGFTIGLSANYLNLRNRTPFSNGYYYGSRFYVVHSGHNWTTQLFLRGDFPLFSLYGGAGLSELNDFYQVQADGGMVFYPFGNLNFYLGSDISLVLQGNAPSDIIWENNFIFSPFMGFKVAKPFWMEFYAYKGKMYNYRDLDGWNIYNEPNPVNKSAGINFIFYLSKSNTSITLSTSYSDATSYYYQSENISGNSHPINYHILNIKGVIKWNF